MKKDRRREMKEKTCQTTDKRFEEFKKHRKQKSSSELGKMFDDLEELEEMWIREIVRDEVKKCLEKRETRR